MAAKILVVEDDPALRDVIVEVLRDEGYAVDEARDGLRALERIWASAPDLVLSDVMMPFLSGIQLADRIRHMGRPIPIVLMSAGRNAPRGDSTPFLAKPFLLDDLVALVDRVLTATGGQGLRVVSPQVPSVF